jgi:hypothetical protein
MAAVLRLLRLGFVALGGLQAGMSDVLLPRGEEV